MSTSSTTVHRARRQGDGSGPEAHDERTAGSCHKSREDVATEPVETEPEVAARSGECRTESGPGGVVRLEQRGEDPHEHDEQHEAQRHA
jgi:hypothetical protein